MDPGARKGRVADVALGCLEAYGFALTTFEEVARAADLGVHDVRALFGDMEGLMLELVSPLLDRLRAITTSAARADLRQAQEVREVIEHYLDVLVTHRRVVGVVVADPSVASSESARLVRAAMSGIRDELAGGTGADLNHTIRATSALGAVQAAVLERGDLDSMTVRDAITAAAVAIIWS